MTPKIFVGIPVYGGVPVEFLQSLMKLQAEPPFPLAIKFLPGDSLVSRARNSLTAEFLAGDCTHLLFIDSDLVFSGGQIKLLVESNKPVIGGFYPKKKQGSVEWVCNTFPGGTIPDESGIQPVRYMGTGFLLVAREVFEKMMANLPGISYAPDHAPETVEHDFWPVGVYSGPDGKRRYLSEDWFFCQRWLDLGGEVFGHRRIILRHLGQASYPLQSQMAQLVPPDK